MVLKGDYDFFFLNIYSGNTTLNKHFINANLGNIKRESDQKECPKRRHAQVSLSLDHRQDYRISLLIGWMGVLSTSMHLICILNTSDLKVQLSQKQPQTSIDGK